MISNIVDALSIICFGWPAIIAAVLLSIAGLLMKKSNLLVIAGVVFTPFTYYLSGGLRNPLVVMPFLLFAAAFAIHRGKTTVAWLLLLPLVLVVLWLAFVVFSQ